MTYPQIGSRYYGADWSRPALRQLPRHWVLEETRDDMRRAPWCKVRRWLWLAFLATVALGYVVAVKAVLA